MRQTIELTYTISKWKVIQVVEGKAESLEMNKFCEAIVSMDGSTKTTRRKIKSYDMTRKSIASNTIPFTAISCNIPGKSLGMGVFVTIVMNISTNCESLLKLKQTKSFIAGTEMFPSICKLRLLDKK
uniref:NL0D n=1 Tax=Solanum tuberosum TaxID=4113 RepID=M0ZNP5_SOLTU